MKLLDATIGQSYSDNGENCRTHCLHCGGDSLEISNETPHQYQCWKCKQSGNGFTFLQTWYDTIPTLSEEDAARMCDMKKGTSASSWKSMGLKLSRRGFVCPCRNNEGKVVSIYRFDESSNNWISTPKPFSLSVMGIQDLQADGEVWIAEGHADYNVLLQQERESRSLLGLCGSSFPAKQLSILESRDVVFLGDNDEAGLQGVHSLAKRAKKAGAVPTSLRYLDWKLLGDQLDVEFSPKEDLRDLHNYLLENEDG